MGCVVVVVLFWVVLLFIENLGEVVVVCVVCWRLLVFVGVLVYVSVFWLVYLLMVLVIFFDSVDIICVVVYGCFSEFCIGSIFGLLD